MIVSRIIDVGKIIAFRVGATTNKKLLNLLKDKKYIANQNWVIELCKDGKLDAAIKRAEDNIKAAEAADDLNSHSYSYIYKVFTINNQNHQ